MECGICEKWACQHGRYNIKGNISTCCDCGESFEGGVHGYCLPFLEGEINFESDYFRTVCKECHDKHKLK